MIFIKEWNEAQLSEKVAALTTIIILMGLFYKVGYYQFSFLNASWVIQFFSVYDLAFGVLKILLVAVSSVVLYQQIFSTYKGERNVWAMGCCLAALCCIGLYERLIDPSSPLSMFMGLVYLICVFASTYLLQGRKEARYFGLITVVVIVPLFKGLVDIDYELKKDKLPKVLIKDEKNEAKNDWRLLDKVGDKILLINVKNTRQLKMITLEKVDKFETVD